MQLVYFTATADWVGKDKNERYIYIYIYIYTRAMRHENQFSGLVTYSLLCFGLLQVPSMKLEREQNNNKYINIPTNQFLYLISLIYIFEQILSTG